MPYVGADFTNATQGETITYFFDFSNALAPGEVIASATWTAAVANDSTTFDQSAASIVDGPASIVGNIVGQKFFNMVGGVKYLVEAIAITSQGETIIPWSHFYTDIPS